ncbi:uncharacterized protein LOC134215705 isoform X1 [Armigeres subalbatus]|uniref:uncharacterized protein LOC134215705 isoform X1 n=1 Tax=Armigeres subalbatus TaxID=124917 RepID=UPI002ED06BBA
MHELFGLLGPSASYFCHAEGILDMETFAMLDETDFNRLNLNTGQRKKIQKLQKESQNAAKFIQKDLSDSVPYEDIEYIDSEADASVSLEKEFDIDLVFQATPEGRYIIQSLQEQNSVTSKLIKSVTKVLSEYLIERFGFHPSVHHKNIVATSLVNKYKILKSESADIPQALWFYPNGRGYGRHSGKLHYHIEYLVKKHEKQIHRKNLCVDETVNSIPSTSSTPENFPGTTDNNLTETINKLKFIVPSEESFKIIRADWIKTVMLRNELRQNDDCTGKMIEMFPLSMAFDGSLINLDFDNMFPSANKDEDVLGALQGKILDKFNHLHPTIDDQFIRLLLVIKEKNPTRGAKRANKGPKTIANLLERIVEWINPEDNVEHFAATYRATDNPVLVVRGPLYCVGETYIRVGKRIFSGGSELQNAFFIMIKTHYFFNLKFEQSLANFFSFFTSAVLNVSKPSTTTNGFLLQLR